MKILFITPYYKPYFGGIERVIERLSSEFQAQDHSVGILTTKWVFPSSPREKRQYRKDLPDEELLESGEKLFRIASTPTTAPPFYQVPLVWFSPMAIKKIIDEYNPDVIQLMNDRWFWGDFWAWFWGRKKHVAFSLSFHELKFGEKSNPVLWTVKQLLRLINRILTRSVSWVQVITNHEKQKVVQTYGTPGTKIEIIPWGVAMSDDVPEVKENKEETSVRLVSVGRISEHKGQRWLTEIVRELSEVIEKPVELYLVGKDDGLGAQIKEDFPDTDHFSLHITGEVSEEKLNAQYQQADIFVLFPEYEAFGLVFLEAMVHGIPVVTHRVGAIEEVLVKGALLTDAYNKAQAKVVLSKLIEDVPFRAALGREALSFARANFSWERTAERFLNQYHKGATI